MDIQKRDLWVPGIQCFRNSPISMFFKRNWEAVSQKGASHYYNSHFTVKETEAQRGHAGRAWIQTPKSILCYGINDNSLVCLSYNILTLLLPQMIKKKEYHLEVKRLTLGFRMGSLQTSYVTSSSHLILSSSLLVLLILYDAKYNVLSFLPGLCCLSVTMTKP